MATTASATVASVPVRGGARRRCAPWYKEGVNENDCVALFLGGPRAGGAWAAALTDRVRTPSVCGMRWTARPLSWPIATNSVANTVFPLPRAPVRTRVPPPSSCSEVTMPRRAKASRSRPASFTAERARVEISLLAAIVVGTLSPDKEAGCSFSSQKVICAADDLLPTDSGFPDGVPRAIWGRYACTERCLPRRTKGGNFSKI